MKTFFGTLLFTFVVLAISSEVSSQSDQFPRGEGGSGVGGGERGRGRGVGGAERGRGRGRGRGIPEIVITIQLGNKPRGHEIVLPNGNIYISNGRGSMKFEYNLHQQVIDVQQGPINTRVPPGTIVPSSQVNTPTRTVLRLEVQGSYLGVPVPRSPFPPTL